MSMQRYGYDEGATGAARVPPQNKDVEMCVLAGIMLDPHNAVEIVGSILKPADFYLDGHKLLYRVMLELAATGTPPDMVAVLDKLRAMSDLDQIMDQSKPTALARVGGTGVVMGMLNSVPTAQGVEDHAKLVKTKAMYRDLITQNTMAIDACYKQELEPSEIADGMVGSSEAIMDSAAGANGSGIKSASQVVDTSVADLMKQLELGQLTTAKSTGIPDLDDLSGGLMPQEVWTLAAATGTGKTRVSLYLAALQATPNEPVGYINLEMAKHKFAEYLSTTISGIAGNYHTPKDLFRSGGGEFQQAC